MLIQTGIRIYIAYFLVSRGIRYLWSDFVQYLPESFYNPSLHLIPLSMYPVTKFLPAIFVFWILSGLGVIFFFEKVWNRWLFLVATYFFIAPTNQIVLPLRIDNLVFIFLILLLLMSPNAKTFEEVQKNRILIFFGRFFWVLLYFGSGLYKLVYAGVEWAHPENMQSQIIERSQYAFCNTEWWILIPKYLVSHVQVIQVIAVAALLFELSYPMIFLKRLRNFYLVVTLLFHLGIFIILDIKFVMHLGGAVFWFIAATNTRDSSKSIYPISRIFPWPFAGKN